MKNSNRNISARRLFNRRRLCTALGAGFLLGTSITAAFAQDVELDRIRAVVNEGVVLQSELTNAVKFFKTQASSNAQGVPPDNVIRERILDQLIHQEVRRQHARALGVSVDAGSVNRAIEQIASSNNMDTLRFRDTLQQQGFSYDMFRSNIEQEILLQRLIERDVQSRIRVSQQEIDDYVDSARNEASDSQRYRLSHILIAAPTSASEEQFAAAQRRANDILKSLSAGENFAQVAAANSDGARALQGGDLGWRTLQELPEFLTTAVRSLDIDELAGPLRSDNGLHIVKLTDLQSGSLTKQAETLARHIFIAGDSADIQRTLNNARRQIIGGAEFGQLAAQLSQDPNSANQNGELPWFTRGQMPPAMEQMADTLAINAISQPFRTQFGWHLLQVLDRRERQIEEQQLREQAANALRQRKVEQETERWTQQLRDESFVEIRS